MDDWKFEQGDVIKKKEDYESNTKNVANEFGLVESSYTVVYRLENIDFDQGFYYLRYSVDPDVTIRTELKSRGLVDTQFEHVYDLD